MFQRRIVDPVLAALKDGATPERLAWSLAIGVAVGINPLLGSTTVVALLLAGVFRLNFVGSQAACHLSYPLELLLLPVWIKLGALVFRAGHMPFGARRLVNAFRHHPLDTTRALWTWEWHALVVWACAAPLLVLLLRPALVPMLRRLLARHQGQAVAVA